MNDHAGVWIDHRKAVIVGLTPDGEVTTVILSRVEKHPERGGDSPMKGAYEARQVPADDSRQRRLVQGDGLEPPVSFAGNGSLQRRQRHAG